MWKEFSVNYLRRNRASSLSIAIAALISALFLSLICGVFYNIWADDISLTSLKEGSWHGKLTGSFTAQQVEEVALSTNVANAEYHENEPALWLYLRNPRSIYRDLPQIAAKLGADQTNIVYHKNLLSRNFILGPGETLPNMVLIYLFTLVIACASLVMMIHNAFGASMASRIRQLGILQSVGATPHQIRQVLFQEALFLCLVPILLGSASGIAACYGFMRLMESVAGSVRQYPLMFRYHPFVYLFTLATSILTVSVSAWIPARRMSRLTPLEAIRQGDEPAPKSSRRFRLFSALFGIEGELARKSLYARRKALRTASLSITASLFVFCGFLNMETISRLSTQETYFARYRNVWDVMVSADVGNDAAVEPLLTGIRRLDGVSDCIAYRLASAKAALGDEAMSDALRAMGGLSVLRDTGIKQKDGLFLIQTPLIVLDAQSFFNFCESLGIDGQKAGAVVINTIWDNVSSDRIDKRYLPFISPETDNTIALTGTGQPVYVDIVGYAANPPTIRESYPNFSLPLVLSEEAYRNLAEDFPSTLVSFNIRTTSENAIHEVETDIRGLFAKTDGYTLENRPQKEAEDANIRSGYNFVVGALSALLALIGLANIFSNALGQTHQRKREFARFLSIGLTPESMRNVMFLEAAVLGVKPVLLCLALNVLLVLWGLNTAGFPMEVFLRSMHIAPIAAFIASILCSVGLAYYLGYRRIHRLNLLDMLRNDAIQ